MNRPIIVAALAFALASSPAIAGEAGHEGKPGKPHAHGSKGHGAALGEPGNPKKASRTIEVAMGDDMRFRPASIEVKKGETIRFRVKNDGQLRHEMVLGTRAELEAHAAHMRKSPAMAHDDPNAVSVEPGGTGTLVWHFTKAGRFDFACLVPGHFEAGMQGKIVVGR